MDNDRSGQVLRVDAALVAAVDHVRLAYHYLDIGDVEGYSSLFEDGALLTLPGRPPVRGRDEEERSAVAPEVAHEVLHVFGSDQRLAVLGRMVGADRRVREFVDLFVVSDRALFVQRRRFTTVAESDGISVL